MSTTKNNTPQIFTTTKYSTFKILPFQRPVSEEHVKKLKRSIKEYNMLSVNPVIVDKNNYIIDGQHRVQACKELKIPVIYTILYVDAIADPKVIKDINTQSAWQTKNYLSFYQSLGNENYIRFEEICKNYEIPTSYLYYLVRAQAGDYLQRIKDGEMQLPPDAEEFMKSVAPFHHDAKNLLPKKQVGMLTRQVWCQTLYLIFHKLGPKFPEFLEAIKKGLPSMVSFRLKEDVIRYLELHANKGRKKNKFAILDLI